MVDFRKVNSMSDKVDEALDKFYHGYNCAQAVICTFCKECNLNEADMFRISEGFGSGMALGEMCGALSGMIMVISAINSNLENEKSTKPKTYHDIKEYINRFKDKNGSYLCRELKNCKDGKILCSCKQCVIDAVQLIEAYLIENDC